jgi:hypothetical protein
LRRKRRVLSFLAVAPAADSAQIDDAAAETGIGQMTRTIRSLDGRGTVNPTHWAKAMKKSIVAVPAWVSAKSHRRVLALILPPLVLLAIYAPTHHFFANQYDDSYISYRYAINLAQGNGIEFNAGERTDSATSFLYTIILSAFWKLGISNLEFVGAALGVFSLALICLYTFKLANYLSSDSGVSLVVAICCGLNGFLAGWTLSGMETLPWTMLVLLAVYFIVTDTHYGLVVGAIAAAAFTRFEGIFLIVAYLPTMLTRPLLKRETFAMAGVVIAFALFYVVKHEYFGVWISHAYQMKEILNYYRPSPHEMMRNWMMFASVPLFLSIPAFWNTRYIGVLLYLFISMLSVAFGPRSDWSRYSVHLLPLIYAFSAITITRMTLWPRGAGKEAALSIVVAAMSLQAMGGELFSWFHMTRLAEHQICRGKLGDYINSNVSGDSYIASSDLGMIAYRAINHRFVDLIALTSADVLANYRQGKTADDILARKNVHYLADTVDPRSSANRIDSMLLQFPQVKGRSKFVADTADPEFTCTEKSGIQFVVARVLLLP